MESQKILIKSHFIIKSLLKLKKNRTYIKYNNLVKRNTYSFVRNSEKNKTKKTIKRSSKSMKSALLFTKNFTSYLRRKLGINENDKEFKENQEKIEENNTKLENTDNFVLNEDKNKIDENNEQEEYENSSYSDEDEQEQNTTTDDGNETEDEQQQNTTVDDDLEDYENENDDNQEKDVGQKIREQLEILKSGKRSVTLLGDIKSRRTSIYLNDNNRNNDESDVTKILLQEKKSDSDSGDSGISPGSLTKESQSLNERNETPQEITNMDENYEKEIEKNASSNDVVIKNCQMNSEINSEWLNNDEDDDEEMESLVLSDSENEKSVENVEKNEHNATIHNISSEEEIENCSSIIVDDSAEKITSGGYDCEMIVNNTKNDDFRPSHIDAIVGKVIGKRSLNLDETSHNKSIIDALYSKVTVNKGNENISIAKTAYCSSPQPSTSKAALSEYSEISVYEENKNTYNPGSVSSEESSTSEFLGFSESELRLPSLPGMLPTPIVMKKSATTASSVFVSEDLEEFLRENDLENSASYDLWSFKTQSEQKSNENGLVLHNTKPPILLSSPIGGTSKPRTLAAKRQQLKNNSEMYAVEIESSIYYQLKKRIKSEPFDQNVINSIQDSVTPLRRNYWKILSWLNTPIGKYYFQKIKIDDKEYKLFGSKGNHDENYLLCTNSKVINRDNEKTRYCSNNCKQNTNLNNIEICNDLHFNKNNEFKKILNKIENNNSVKDIENQIEIKNQCNNRPGPLRTKCLKLSSNPNLGLTEIYNMPSVQLEVYPKINRPLDDAVKSYLKLILPSDNISHEWAKFSVSTLVTKNQQNPNNENNNEENEINRNCFTFNIPYNNNQNKLLVRRIYNLNKNVEDLQDGNENLDKFNFYKNVNKNDKISIDCGNILNEMINSVVLSISGDLLIKNDPDINYNKNEENKIISSTSNDNNTNMKCTQKDRKKPSSKLQLELKRLNATVIDTKNLQNEPNCEYKQCNKESCRLGCICDSLNYQSCQTHCRNENCMFECSCKNYSSVSGGSTNSTITKHDALLLRKKVTEKLAKVEKEFTHTILITPEETFLLNDSNNERKRPRKTPKRWGDYISEGILAESQKQQNENNKETNQDNKENVQTKMNDCHLPLMITDRLINTESQNDNKSYILKNLKHLNVELIKLDLNDIEPWCMTHCAYKCNCYNNFYDNTTIDNENQNVSVHEENKTLRKRKHSSHSSINMNNSNYKSDQENNDDSKDSDIEEKQQKMSTENTSKRKPGRPKKNLEFKPIKVKVDKIKNRLRNPRIQKNRILFCRERHDKMRYTKYQPDTCSRLREIPSISFRNMNRRRAEAVKYEILRNENDYKQELLRKHIQNNLLIESKNKESQEESDVLMSEESRKKELSKTTVNEISTSITSPHSATPPPPPSLPSHIDLAEQMKESSVTNNNNNNNSKLPIISLSTNKASMANQVYCHFISKLNEFVSKRMHTICESQRLRTIDLPDPEPDRTLDLHITPLRDAYKKNTVQVWQCKIDDQTFYTITKKSMPIIENALSVVNIKTLPNSDLPFLCKLLKSDDNIKIPDNTLLFVLLIGVCQYWLIKGFNLANENSLEKGRIFKPTPQTHPWLSPKISELYQHLFSNKILPENVNQNQQQCTQKNTQKPDNIKQKIIHNQKNIQFPKIINPEQDSNRPSTSSEDNSLNVAKTFSVNNVVENNDVITMIDKFNFKTNLSIRKLTSTEAEYIGSIAQTLTQFNNTYWLTIEAVNDFSHIYISLCKKFLPYCEIENSLQLANNSSKIFSFNLYDGIKLFAIKKINNSIGTCVKKENIFYLFIGPFKINDNNLNNLQIMLYKLHNNKMLLREYYEKYHKIKRKRNTNAFWLYVNSNNKLMCDLDMRSIKILGQDNNCNTKNNVNTINNSKDYDDDCYIVDEDDVVNCIQDHAETVNKEITNNNSKNVITNSLVDVSKQKSPLKIASVSSLNPSQFILQQQQQKQRNLLNTESSKIYTIKRKNPELIEIPPKKNCHGITTSLPLSGVKQQLQQQQQQSLPLSNNSEMGSSSKINATKFTTSLNPALSTLTSKLIYISPINNNPSLSNISNNTKTSSTSGKNTVSSTAKNKFILPKPAQMSSHNLFASIGNNKVQVNPSIIKQINLIKTGGGEGNQSNQSTHNIATATTPDIIAVPVVPLTTNNKVLPVDGQIPIDNTLTKTSATCSVVEEQQQQQGQNFLTKFRNFVDERKNKEGRFPKSKSVKNTTIKTQKFSTLLSHTYDEGNITAGTVVTTPLTTPTMVFSNNKSSQSLIKRPVIKSLKYMLPSSFVLFTPSTLKQNTVNSSDSAPIPKNIKTVIDKNKRIYVNNEAKPELLNPSTSSLKQHEQKRQQQKQTNTINKNQSTTSGVKLSKLPEHELERLKNDEFKMGHFVSDYSHIKFPTKLYNSCFLLKSPDNKILKLDRGTQNASLHITSYMKDVMKTQLPAKVTDMNWKFVPYNLTKAQKHNATATATTTTTKGQGIQQSTERRISLPSAESSSSYNENNATKNLQTNCTDVGTSLNTAECNNTTKLNLISNNIPGILKHSVISKNSKPIQNKATNPLIDTPEIIIIDDDDDDNNDVNTNNV